MSASRELLVFKGGVLAPRRGGRYVAPPDMLTAGNQPQEPAARIHRFLRSAAARPMFQIACFTELRNPAVEPSEFWWSAYCLFKAESRAWIDGGMQGPPPQFRPGEHQAEVRTCDGTVVIFDEPTEPELPESLTDDRCPLICGPSDRDLIRQRPFSTQGPPPKKRERRPQERTALSTPRGYRKTLPDNPQDNSPISCSQAGCRPWWPIRCGPSENSRFPPLGKEASRISTMSVSRQGGRPWRDPPGAFSHRIGGHYRDERRA